jgi:hypothetical protein
VGSLVAVMAEGKQHAMAIGQMKMAPTVCPFCSRFKKINLFIKLFLGHPNQLKGDRYRKYPLPRRRSLACTCQHPIEMRFLMKNLDPWWLISKLLFFFLILQINFVVDE